MPSKLKKFILFSVVFHIVALFVLWYNPPGKELESKSYKVTWIKLSKGDGGTSQTASFKNSTSLPKSTIREQKMALKEKAIDKTGSDLKSHKSKTKKTVKQKESLKKTAENAGVKIKKKKKKHIAKKKKPQTKEDRILDALARIDQDLKQRKVDMSVAQAKEGNTGQSPYGTDKGDVIDPALIAYYNKIKKKINKEWILSKGDYAGTLVAKIVVMIDSSGNILRSHLKTTSGDNGFDSSALRAIKRSAPFPVPPENIRQEALTEGFLIEFNPKMITGRM